MSEERKVVIDDVELEVDGSITTLRSSNIKLPQYPF